MRVEITPRTTAAIKETVQVGEMPHQYTVNIGATICPLATEDVGGVETILQTTEKMEGGKRIFQIVEDIEAERVLPSTMSAGEAETESRDVLMVWSTSGSR